MDITQAKKIKFGHVLIKPDVEEVVTKSGIVLAAPSVAEMKRKLNPTTYGEVINVGDGVDTVAAGNRVLYSTWSPSVHTVGKGEEAVDYHLIDQESILALIENDEEEA